MRAPDAPFQPVTADDVNTWLASARPGQRLAYHVGILARDRARLDKDGRLTPKALELELVATAVWAAREAGGVWALAQCRVTGGCEYLVIKR